MKLKAELYKNDHYLGLVLLHIVIGFTIFLFEPFAKLYFVIIMVYFLGRIILVESSKKTQEVLLGCAYFAGAEVLFRNPYHWS